MGIIESTVKYDHKLEAQGEIACQTLSFIFMWLADVLNHPLRDTQAFKGCEAAWPFDVSVLPEGASRVLYGSYLPQLDPSLLDFSTDGVVFAFLWESDDAVCYAVAGSDGAENKLRMSYMTLAKRYCAELLAQIEVCECLSINTLNAFTKESLVLRRVYAWSIPCEAALQKISSYSPLIEIGCGTGYWADILTKRGCDILAFNSEEWSEELSSEEGDMGQCGLHPSECFGEVLLGGAEKVKEHPDRTLLLMWPDFLGKGSFGLKSLDEYEGEFLILVGEWKGRTWGGYTPELGDHGQSFSQEFQEAVTSSFEEVEVIRLPCWPLFLDTVMVFRRKSLQSLMEQNGAAQCEPNDMLAAFFAGSFDPFAGLDLEGDQIDVD
ncbi:hypothetical protein GUITHDRAFT_102771 [Guillardia theta CCMP2712]|uniref:Methyltransferase domain-containing protein n=1 Tax=Guillardia theta (strain CCMP2712) TaxID=905079 RepID=L1JTH7_GUITC|nr:hypothetical protein GUITHDRAFT_102771 [Guillardia theta CCMP2712]EKX51505.1 hypothetical protein GUITHDRAFT_102771 [Guillardia theta CCMP2712]|eukprot:XP_005838485.1 hypothetical protein GUITHDRAFT_102771 [Guillardia theta CCMP2712]